jgi:hypothetical protein
MRTGSGWNRLRIVGLLYGTEAYRSISTMFLVLDKR